MIDQVSLDNFIDQREKLNRREEEVFQALVQLGESTSWDILNYLGETNPNVVRPRLNGLMEKGYVEKIKQVKVNGINQWTWDIRR